jgi:hypothetical protein
MKMNNYTKHALKEFRAAGWTDENGNFNDEMQEAICNHVLKLLDVFDGEGHSGTSAPYTINIFKKLAMFEPIAPLTGEDSEWNEVYEGVFQNNRMDSVFKQADRFDGQPYWLDGKVFWEWVTHPDIDDGKPFKSHFTGSGSLVPIQFPWVKPEHSEYVFVPTDAFPNEVL